MSATQTRHDVPRYLIGGLLLALLVARADVVHPQAQLPATLRFAHGQPPAGILSETNKWWAEEITKRTAGSVKIQHFWSESLMKMKDFIGGLGSGATHVAQVCSTYEPSRTPLWMTLDMPYNGRDDWALIRASAQIVNEDPALKAEFERNGMKPLTAYSSGQLHLISTRPVAAVSHLQGRRFRSFGGARVRWAEEVGISPVFMPGMEVYQAVDRRVLEGAEMTIYLIEVFKLYEVTKHLVLAHSGAAVGCVNAINLKLWNAFPEKIRQVFQEVSTEANQAYAKQLIAAEASLLKKFQQKDRVKVVTLGPSEAAVLEDAGRRAQTKWLAEMDAKGVPARETWERYQALVKKYEAEVASKGYPWEPK